MFRCRDADREGRERDRHRHSGRGRNIAPPLCMLLSTRWHAQCKDMRTSPARTHTHTTCVCVCVCVCVYIYVCVHVYQACVTPPYHKNTRRTLALTKRTAPRTCTDGKGQGVPARSQSVGPHARRCTVRYCLWCPEEGSGRHPDLHISVLQHPLRAGEAGSDRGWHHCRHAGWHGPRPFRQGADMRKCVYIYIYVYVHTHTHTHTHTQTHTHTHSLTHSLTHTRSSATAGRQTKIAQHARRTSGRRAISVWNTIILPQRAHELAVLLLRRLASEHQCAHKAPSPGCLICHKMMSDA